jgi:hypothetical protein
MLGLFILIILFVVMVIIYLAFAFKTDGRGNPWKL